VVYYYSGGMIEKIFFFIDECENSIGCEKKIH
jgi:hypothetical protein